MALSEKEVRRLMESDAYSNRTNKNYEKVNREVKQGWENLYPDDDRNENPENYYVWRTKGDDRVRGKHAEREGGRCFVGIIRLMVGILGRIIIADVGQRGMSRQRLKNPKKTAPEWQIPTIISHLATGL